jgi:hypothetical protein
VTPEGSTHVDTFTGTTSSISRTAAGKVAVVAVVRQRVVAQAPWPDPRTGAAQAACQGAAMGEISGLQIADVTLTDAQVRDVEVRRPVFWRVRMRGAYLGEVVIDGEIEELRVNGVDVGPLVEAELDRRYPDRPKMRPTDVAGYREAWDILEALWAGTVERARSLPPELLHESVDGEWSFIQTLRHLLFATDIWVSRAMFGDPTPWHPLSLPFDQMKPDPRVPWDREARPDLDEVLALRADRMRTVRRALDGLTEEGLAGRTEPVDGPGYPPADSYLVTDCLGTVLNEEWHHRLYAERDLDVLRDRPEA